MTIRHCGTARFFGGGADPEILLMDEWIGAGDASSQEKGKKRMNELAEKAGIIVPASLSEGLIQSACTTRLTLRGG